MQVIYCIFLLILLWNFNRFSADSDGVTDRLPDGSTDESDDGWMERNLPRFCMFWKFHPAILVVISIVNLADGWMDETHD